MTTGTPLDAVELLERVAQYPFTIDRRRDKTDER
jgi:hypothetical protein